MKNLNINVPNYNAYLDVMINYGASTVFVGAIVGMLLEIFGQVQEPNFNLKLQIGIVVIAWFLGLGFKRLFAGIIYKKKFAEQFIWFNFKTEFIWQGLLMIGVLIFNTELFGLAKGFL